MMDEQTIHSCFKSFVARRLVRPHTVPGLDSSPFKRAHGPRAGPFPDPVLNQRPYNRPTQRAANPTGRQTTDTATGPPAPGTIPTAPKSQRTSPPCFISTRQTTIQFNQLCLRVSLCQWCVSHLCN
jgi:hypothetical protein